MTIYLIIGILVILVIGYFILDYFMLGKGYDLTRRLKYFFMTIFLFPLGAFLVWGFVGEITDSIDLAKNGVEVVAIVKESKIVIKYRRRRSRTYYINTLIYDGHEKKCELDKAYDIDTKFYLVYSSKNPDNAIVSKLQNGFIEYLSVDNSWSSISFLIVSPLFCLAMGVRSIILLLKKESVLDSIEE